MLLALDCSTRKFGFAFGRPEDAAPRSGSWSFPGADDAVLDETFGSAFDTISNYAVGIKATHVAIEAPAMIVDRSAHTMMALIQLTGVVRAAAHRARCKVALVSSQSARKFFVGTLARDADKKAAVQERCRLIGWEAAGHDAADACAVWAWGCNHFWERPNSSPLFARGRAA